VRTLSVKSLLLLLLLGALLGLSQLQAQAELQPRYLGSASSAAESLLIEQQQLIEDLLAHNETLMQTLKDYRQQVSNYETQVQTLTNQLTTSTSEAQSYASELQILNKDLLDLANRQRLTSTILAISTGLFGVAFIVSLIF
jgi:chromosome segregation ATPase